MLTASTPAISLIAASLSEVGAFSIAVAFSVVVIAVALVLLSWGWQSVKRKGKGDGSKSFELTGPLGITAKLSEEINSNLAAGFARLEKSVADVQADTLCLKDEIAGMKLDNANSHGAVNANLAALGGKIDTLTNRVDTHLRDHATAAA